MTIPTTTEAPAAQAPAPVTRDGVLDVATAQDRAALSRAAEKLTLITEIAILADRMDALKEMVEAKKARLNVLMTTDGDQRLTAPAGAASFTPHRAVKVTDPAKAAARFDKETLAEFFRPTTAFIDALTTAGIAYGDCIEVSDEPSFEVRRPQTKEAKSFREIAIEKTKAETANTIARIVAKLTGRAIT